MLPGSTHKTVVIYVNGKKSLTVPVADEAALEALEHRRSRREMPPSSTELAGGGLLVVLEASATITSAKRCWFVVGNTVHVNLLSS